ncbi:FtsB family cell division protein [Rickettsiales endosymbiont of Trichoplax sp. H2]|uniref:FtsB family cell division protein n=1 Tax=Rickettsiales endosymbiont of Trichoplax sp. H2 TaxID=2021221 RepID=UPI0012B20360|nr:septum formation initiator family protein [Rickettsiales endosymbiont of Trichoplax sp. H2]MSO14327.1 Uncharacterized protein [Rickettsiales endosymbiont of Trichoplax sp. H2]
MNKNNTINYALLIFNFIFIVIIFYFTLHCFVGERGYIKMLDLKDELIIRKKELSLLQDQKKYLENKVNLIYDKSINKDYLDELSRKNFGLIGVNEVCIFENQ